MLQSIILQHVFFFGAWITGSFSSIYSIRFADLDIFEIVACIKRILQKNLLLKFLISFKLHLITLMHITYMYIIRLKKKWNKGAPTGACSFYVMRNLWNEIRVILACLVLVKVYFLGEVM